MTEPIFPQPPRRMTLEQLIEHYKAPSLFTLLTMPHSRYNQQHTNVLECSYLQSSNGIIEMCDKCGHNTSVTLNDRNTARKHNCTNIERWVCRYAMAAEIALKQCMVQSDE